MTRIDGPQTGTPTAVQADGPDPAKTAPEAQATPNPRIVLALDELEIREGGAAVRLGVSPRTVEDWRAGAPVPGIHLRDICRILAVERLDLLQPPASSLEARPLRTSRHTGLRKGWDGFGGHLGLCIPGRRRILWLPVREGDLRRLDRLAPAPFAIHGLGLSAAWVNPRSMNGICLLGEDEDGLRGNWSLSRLDPSHGLNPELLNGLVEFHGDEAGLMDRTRVSCAYSSFIRSFIDAVGRKRLDRALALVRIHMADGTCHRLPMDGHDAPSLCRLLQGAGKGWDDDAILTLGHRSRRLQLPLARVALIRLPRTLLRAGMPEAPDGEPPGRNAPSLDAPGGDAG